jgi:hypothetical protein
MSVHYVEFAGCLMFMNLVWQNIYIFSLQDEETGAWYQHRGRDFRVPLVDYLQRDGNMVGAKRGFGLWPGCRNYYILWFTSFIHV